MPFVATLEGSRPDSVPPKKNQFTLDVTFLGLKAGYARRTERSRFLGASVGLGGDYALNAMVLAGRHFSQDGWLAYEGRDQYGGEHLWEVLQVDLFVRTDRDGHWQWDVGLHGSVFAHWDDSDDEPGAGSFVGGYIAPMWGGRHLKLGPRLLAGFFSEGRAEFGINVSLLAGRVLLPW